MKRLLEIHPAEGGEDSKLFVRDLADAYVRLSNAFRWKSIVTEHEKYVTIEITGKNLKGLDNESGGHRVQRVPPTEKKGRVHTSTVVVSVFNPATIDTNDDYNKISDDYFKVEWFSGTGKGGQKRNKSQSCCRVIHLPTGLSETRQGRSRESNLEDAKNALIDQLQNAQHKYKKSQQSEIKNKQTGSGMRADKIRTYRFQDNQVLDHNTNKKAKATKVMKGRMDLLWM